MFALARGFGGRSSLLPASILNLNNQILLNNKIINSIKIRKNILLFIFIMIKVLKLISVFNCFKKKNEYD